jgi:hypothetical protein
MPVRIPPGRICPRTWPRESTQTVASPWEEHLDGIVDAMLGASTRRTGAVLGRGSTQSSWRRPCTQHSEADPRDAQKVGRLGKRPVDLDDTNPLMEGCLG